MAVLFKEINSPSTAINDPGLAKLSSVVPTWRIKFRQTTTIVQAPTEHAALISACKRLSIRPPWECPTNRMSAEKIVG